MKRVLNIGSAQRLLRPGSPLLCLGSLLLCLSASAHGASPAADEEAAIRLANPRPARWQVGVVVRARGAMRGIVATLPIPMAWPEQDVEIVDEDVSPHVRSVRYRELDNGVKQMMISIPRLAAGEEATALVTLEIVKRDILLPVATGGLQVPSNPSRSVRKYLVPSPYIESRDRKIGDLAAQLVAGKAGAWQQVEAIYDGVREKVEYRFDRQIKSARKALDDGFGDCEELTSLFVAMCRSVEIPARAVWVPGHCYPEFYLEDAQGQGHWYPCQAAGSRIFGSMVEPKPVLQKGDNFRVPGTKGPQRYVQETLIATSAAADPEVKFIQRRVDGEPEADRSAGQVD